MRRHHAMAEAHWSISRGAPVSRDGVVLGVWIAFFESTDEQDEWDVSC